MWLDRQPDGLRWPMRFGYVMVANRCWMVYVPAILITALAWWEHGRIVWQLALLGPDWLDLVVNGLPIFQAASAFVVVLLLILAGARAGWQEGIRPIKSARG